MPDKRNSRASGVLSDFNSTGAALPVGHYCHFTTFQTDGQVWVKVSGTSARTPDGAIPASTPGAQAIEETACVQAKIILGKIAHSIREAAKAHGLPDYASLEDRQVFEETLFSTHVFLVDMKYYAGINRAYSEMGVPTCARAVVTGGNPVMHQGAVVEILADAILKKR